MSNRNKYAKIKKTKIGKNALGSTILPNIPLSPNDIYIYSKVGDRLDMLAQQYYNDVTKWWIIAEANSLEVLSYEVKPGLQLRIPQNNGY